MTGTSTIARGGEVPLSALRQAVRFAASEHYLTPADIAGIAHDMIDALAEVPPHG